MAKNNKNNKTAHVLNLLTAPEAEKEPAQAGETPAEPSAAPAPAARPLTPPILEVARSNDDQLSAQIRDALETAYEEPPQPALQPAPPVPAPEPIPVPDPVPVREAAPAPAPISEPASGPEPADPVPIFVPEDVQPEETAQDDPIQDYAYINVMQALVEEKAAHYMEIFGVCTCPRCQIDVKALTLSKLPSKYVVMRKKDLIPMLTVYEGRYSTAIFSQLTHACKAVMDHPHHGPNRD